MRAALSAALLAGVVVWTAGALDVSLNGVPACTLSSAEVAARSRAVAGGGGWLRGVPLEDLLPVLAEARELTITTASAARHLGEPELAERLGEIVVSASAGGLRVVLPEDLGGSPAGELLRLDVAGTPLEPRRLEIWASWEGVRELGDIVQRYAARHGLELRVTDVPDPKAKTVAVLRGGGSVADLVMVQSDYIPELVGYRALQPLGELRTAPLDGTGWAAFTTRDSRRWAVPFFRDVQLVFYNPTLLGDPPAGWTLPELERLCAPLARKGLVPMAWNAYSAYWLIPFQMGFGKSELVGRDGSMVVNDPATEQAIRYLAGIEERGLLAVVERDAMIGMFGSGKTALILSGSYSIPEFRKAGMPFRVAAFPHAAGGRPLSSLLDYKGFAVSRTTRNPLLARRLLQYLSRPDVQLEFATALDKLPASTAATAAFIASSPYGAAFAEILESATLIPPEPVYGAFKNSMWSLLRLVFSGEMEASEALGVAQKAVDAAYKGEGGTR